MRIDHLFIRARAGAPEAALLQSFGLTEGSGNRHPGSTGTQLTLVEGDTYLMEIYFDHGAQNRTHDCRPGLPLVLHY